MPEVGMGDAQQSAGCPTGVSWDFKGDTGEGRRQGWRRSPLRGLRGVKNRERMQPKNFLHLFPGKERDERVSVFGLVLSRQARDVVAHSRCGWLWAPAIAGPSPMCWKLTTSHSIPAHL